MGSVSVICSKTLDKERPNERIKMQKSQHQTALCVGYVRVQLCYRDLLFCAGVQICL